jgi:hypothetical protein
MDALHTETGMDSWPDCGDGDDEHSGMTDHTASKMTVAETMMAKWGGDGSIRDASNQPDGTYDEMVIPHTAEMTLMKWSIPWLGGYPEIARADYCHSASKHPNRWMSKRC